MRADVYLFTNGYYGSRSKAAQALKCGFVKYNGRVLKPSDEIDGSGVIETEKGNAFASVGGEKLEKAFQLFNLDVNGRTCADIGASNGGFTDCLLRHGAKKVYAVDVGENQLAEPLKQSGRVIIMDNTNARFLDKASFPEEIDFISADLSFISLKYVLGAFSDILSSGKMLAALIKPQFEAGRENVGKNGIVKDKKIHEKIINDITIFASALGFTLSGIAPTDAPGGKNTEYISVFIKR